MSIRRREFLQILAAGALAPGALRAARKLPEDFYEVPVQGNVRLLHMTDSHAQLEPLHFREPSVNIGVGRMYGRPPHVVGNAFLDHFGIAAGTPEAHAFTFLDFEAAARELGSMGGYAHLATLVRQLREQAGDGNSLLLDGGDTWQGSAPAQWSEGMAMVEACNRLGVDVMTGHWEFTYPEATIRKNIEAFAGDFVAHNVQATVDAMFAGVPVYDEDSRRVFPPYTMKTVGGARLAIVGQAFPYVPIAHPQWFIPDWTFGIKEEMLQTLVDRIREQEQPDAVVVLSHNGADVDLKMASRVTGVDVILGGHTHDAVPAPQPVKNGGGTTFVIQSGSHGKMLSVVDLDIAKGRVRDLGYRLLPVYSQLLEPDADMAGYVRSVHAPHRDALGEELATADRLLYRRGNFTGTFDQIFVDALRERLDADISLSPGFRWGRTVLAGEPITMEDVYMLSMITYPETYTREMSGEQIKTILEDVCDNLFNKDPYYQQGGDMVRVGGMVYTCNPTLPRGQRISNLTLSSGRPVSPVRKYKVAGWANVNSKVEGEPVWDVVAAYLRDHKDTGITRWEIPRLQNVRGNPGIARYPRILS